MGLISVCRYIDTSTTGRVLRASEYSICPNEASRPCPACFRDGSGDSEGGSRVRSGKKVDCALALIGQGRPVKPVCSALGVARSHVALMLARPADWVDGRTVQSSHQPADAILVDAVRAEITALPTYGYRRAGALVNRTRALMGLQAVNHKRFYRVMEEHHLLLPKAPKRRVSSHVHDGVVSVAEPNQRWCSDGFEISCDNGDVVTGVFMKDCCDREIITWRAWAQRGLPGEPVRDMLVEAVEARFGQATVGSTKLEFLSDNGGAYRAHETHALARELGIEPVHAGLRKTALIRRQAVSGYTGPRSGIRPVADGIQTGLIR